MQRYGQSEIILESKPQAYSVWGSDTAGGEGVWQEASGEVCPNIGESG